MSIIRVMTKILVMTNISYYDICLLQHSAHLLDVIIHPQFSAPYNSREIKLNFFNIQQKNTKRYIRQTLWYAKLCQHEFNQRSVYIHCPVLIGGHVVSGLHPFFSQIQTGINKFCRYE